MLIKLPVIRGTVDTLIRTIDALQIQWPPVYQIPFYDLLMVDSARFFRPKRNPGSRAPCPGYQTTQ